MPVQTDPDDSTGLMFIGGQVTEAAVVEAARHGLFAWTGSSPVPWCSPNPRALLRPDQVRVPKSLARRIRNAGFEVRLDVDPPAVMAACRDVPRAGQKGTWITPNLEQAWGDLFQHGLAHSVEVFRHGERIGGLYGLSLGAAFFGESMFHVERDASKVAFVALARLCESRGDHFIDCQAMTPHLERMGAQPVPRSIYLRVLAQALAVEHPAGSWADLTVPMDRGAE